VNPVPDRTLGVAPAPEDVPMIETQPQSREEFIRRIDERNLAPLWQVARRLVTDEPQSVIAPYRWRYAEVRPDLLEAARLITAKEAERRVLVLENPNLRGQSKITNSLFGGLQIIMPGEIAPPHRHMPAALRFIIEGNGAYTSVDGERSFMQPGDFVITPSWTYHDHGNDSDGPMIWLDGLDMHIVNLFEASFFERYSSETPIPPSRPEHDSMQRFGRNLVPVEHSYRRKTSPIFSYPYEATRESLEALRRAEDASPWFGYKMRYVNPLTGGDAIPTISTFMQLVPQGMTTRDYRSTDSTVFVVVEGTGSTRIGDQTFDWTPRDVLVAPSWMAYAHTATSGDAVLFSYSDRGIQEMIGIWRDARAEDRRAAPRPT
jgi:gentisate 1,2-dioxygenase